MSSIKSVCAAGKWLDLPLSAVPHSNVGWLQKKLLLRGSKIRGEDVHKGNVVEWLGQPCETMIGSLHGRIFKVSVTADYALSRSISLAMDGMCQVSDALGVRGTPMAGEIVSWDADDGNAIVQGITVMGRRTLSLFLTSNILRTLVP